jgi:hypothetical protein
MEVAEVLKNKTFYMILVIMSFGIIGPGTIVTFYKVIFKKIYMFDT